MHFYSMYIINKLWQIINRVIIRCYGFLIHFSFAECGSGFYPSYPLTVTGPENIKIGNNFSSIGPVYLFANEGKISIGNNFSININVVIGASCGEVKIGNDVLIGPNVVIRSADHGISERYLINAQPHSSGVIVIEDDVWIGANVVILKDVKLGRGCVIGAGSVVTKDVPEYAIFAGVPAKFIKSRVSADSLENLND